MDTTAFVLRLLAVVYLAVGLGMIVSADYYRQVFQKAFKNHTMAYFAPVITLVIGFSIVSFHNVWSGWPVLVTLFGWIATLKGLSMIIFPEKMAKISMEVLTKKNFYGYGAFAFLLGLVFAYFAWAS